MADTIRFLAADMVEKAQSGHPGAPMGMADIAVALSKHLIHNPKDPKWLNRDRLIFSGGHATGLIYSLLHLWGYGISMEDLKNFRQWKSMTPGHPEYGITPGVEITTGPLGQGVANAVGLAMAAKYCARLLNRDNATVIDHQVYCLCGDGDLEEGISYEAASLAGHHCLDNLILIYDSNHTTIDGDTSLAWSENVRMRFEAQQWTVLDVDGHDFRALDGAITQAKEADRPVLIIAETKIAKSACEMEGRSASHGAPLGEEIVARAKIQAGFDPQKSFWIDDDVLARFRCAIEQGELAQKAWNHKLKQLPYAEQNALLDRLDNPDFDAIDWPAFEVGTSIATRSSNAKILQSVAKALPGFLGGSADLAASNKTHLKDMGVFPEGRNFNFGIREHAMGAICNGMAVYGPLLPFCATFFVFSDYMKPSVRIASLSQLKNFFIWTHDSIGVGEDGPTHQPIEQLSQFRALPKFCLFRPADAKENIGSWQAALKREGSCGFVLSRQNLPILEETSVHGVGRGGYLLKRSEAVAAVTLLASGSEVALIMEAAAVLEAEDIGVNVVSVPCMDLLIEQGSAYIESIVAPSTKVLAVEAATGNEWYRFADDVLGMERFGASAPGKTLFENFGFTVANVVERAKALLEETV